MINTAWVMFAVGTAVAFAISAWLYQQGELTLGTVYLITYYAGMMNRPMDRISQEIETLQQAGAGVARIQELMAVESRIDRSGDSLSTEVGDLSAEASKMPSFLDRSRPVSAAFETVSFAYEPSDNGRPPEYVLRDVSFRLESGRVLGLLGRTGSGKTTLTRLLFRLYDPIEGSVFIGDENVRQKELRQLRQQVGIVTQNVQLFHATVRDNLTFFDLEITDQQILDVLHQLELTSWYESLDEGLDTVLEAGGGGLSAGEGQLLAFTRIFLKDPSLVILDEASSRLDPATEQLVEKAVDRLLQDRTAIIIAHHLATVERADEILILEDGRILEQGVRQHLAHDPDSLFYQLLQTGLEEVLA